MENNIRTFELQLLGWSKSTSKKGPQITFQLLDDSELEYFESYTVAKNKIAGQIFDAAFSISDQDSQSQEVTPTKKHKGQKLSQYAAQLCKSEKFCNFLLEFICIGDVYYTHILEKEARDYVCSVCKITSRAELDTNPEAATLFHNEIRKPYEKWCKG